MVLATESKSSAEPSVSSVKRSDSSFESATPVAPKPFISNGTSANSLLGRWRLCVELFGRVFLEDVGSEPSSVLNELGRFDVKETKFRREMERLRNSTQRDLTLEVRWILSLLVYKLLGVKLCTYLSLFTNLLPLPTSHHISCSLALSPAPFDEFWI